MADGCSAPAGSAHAGTLDPLATGLLILGVERGTKLLGHLALKDKTYLATIRLGVTTSTDDAQGETLQARPAGRPDRAGDAGRGCRADR